jgi:hypothetical protein
MGPSDIEVVLDAVIVAVTENEPRILTLRSSNHDGALPGLPSGALDIAHDRTLDRGLRRWIRDQAGIDVGYVEQLYTFGDRFRNPAERGGGPRVLSIAYLALVREEQPSAGAAWWPWYRFLPWEDHRDGEAGVVAGVIAPALKSWVMEAESGADQQRRAERAGVVFGLDETPWDPVRVLDRYELLYHLGLIEEARRGDSGESSPVLPGDPMVLDHRRIAASALSRLRGKLSYRPVVFELLPETFTLLTLQKLVEALNGVRLHKQNFRRLVERGGLVEGTGRRSQSGGRPAELYRFRREVLRERPRPGFGLPARG